MGAVKDIIFGAAAITLTVVIVAVLAPVVATVLIVDQVSRAMK